VSEWQEATLGELCHKITDGAHHSPKEHVNGLPMFSVKDMKEQGFDYSTPKTISADDYDKLVIAGCQPSVGDILIAKDGSVMKHVFYVKEKPDYVLLSSIAILKPISSTIDSAYLTYAIKSPDITDTILNNFVSGSGVPRIVLKDFKKVEIKFPEIEEQKAIASVLSSLDDKIDLLHRQNTTLERMAETLFRQWFLEEAQEDWEECTLDDLISVKGGTTPSTKEPSFWNGNVNWTSPRDLSNQQSVFMFDTERKISEKGLAQIGSGLLPVGTVLMSSRAPIGYLAISDIPVAINQGYIAIVCDKLVSNYFMYQWCKVNMEQIKNSGNGSTFEEISKSNFKALLAVKPPKQVLENFNQKVEAMFRKVKSNQQQIQTLEKLRESLLPKLMSGEVKVELGGN
jgi:type I restriction enzyme S subunit